jgi:hypothetical protein
VGNLVKVNSGLGLGKLFGKVAEEVFSMKHFTMFHANLMQTPNSDVKTGKFLC